jgi:lipid A 3-O-deacylase
MKKLPRTAWAALAVLSLSCAPAGAAGLKPEGAYVQLGVAEHATGSATLGLVWPWAWRRSLGGAEVSGLTELYASQWSAHAFGGGRQSYTQLGLLPVFRLRFDAGRSDWFVEGGIGVTWMDKVYCTPEKCFSTSGQFHDMLGVGKSFGADRSRELSLRLVHYSNAGIKHPNPGIEFLQLRYGWKF